MDGKTVLDRFDSLKQLRSQYEPAWADIARLMRPTGKGFTSSVTEGERKHTGISDSTALVALDHFKAGLYSTMTPPGSMWFELQHVDAEMNEYGPVKDWLRVVNTRTWKSFGPGVSHFYNQVTSVYADLGAFGTGVLYSTEAPPMEQRFIDRARALHECWIDTNELDIVDTLFRRFELTSRAMVTRPEWNIPAKILKDGLEGKAGKHRIIHAVYPERDRDGSYGKRWRECYVLEDKKHILGEAGYFEFPYMTPRWDVAAGERYGTGPGHKILSDVKSLNVARRSNLNMMDRAARPTLLTQKENDIGGGIAPYPGEIVYGGLNSDGKKMVALMDEGKNPAVALEMEERIAAGVKDGMYFGLMQIVGSTNMTATEFLGRDDERQRLLGPYLGRVETEMLSPAVLRRVSMLDRAGQLPPMPEELAESLGAMEVRYVSPLARLLRQRDAESANRTVVALSAAYAMSPEVADRIDPDDLAEMIADGFGANILRPRDVTQKLRDAREQQQQMERMAAAAPGLAKGLRDVSEAGAKMPPQLMGLPAPANAA